MWVIISINFCFTKTKTPSNIQQENNNNRDETISINYPTYNCKSEKLFFHSIDVPKTKRKVEE